VTGDEGTGDGVTGDTVRGDGVTSVAVVGGVEGEQEDSRRQKAESRRMARAGMGSILPLEDALTLKRDCAYNLLYEKI
jgi:hypothetical protein